MQPVLLLCAIPVEWEAISSHIEDSYEHTVGQASCLRGKIDLSGRKIDAVLVEVGVGSLDAALNTAAAVSEFEPSLVVFVGVAGGLKDVQLGDVVIASKVHYYEAGKEDDGGFHPRPDSPPAPLRIADTARAVARFAKDLDFDIVVAPIAAGEKVIASSDSIAASTIRSAYGDAKAVEMEGAGFFGAMRRHPSVDFVLIRGISDLLDGKGKSDSDGWQPTASGHATTVAIQFVERYFQGDTWEVASTSAVEEEVREAIPHPGATERYVLIANDASGIAQSLLRSSIPVTLVVDLDDQTDVSGLLRSCGEELRSERQVKLATLEDLPQQTRSSLTWLAANGLSGRTERQPFSVWRRSARKGVRKYIADFAQANGSRHTTLLVTVDPDHADWARAIADDFLAELGESCTVVGLVDQDSEYLEIEQDHALRVSPGELAQLLLPDVPTNLTDEMLLPGSEGRVSLKPQDVAWLTEELEICVSGGDDRSDPFASRLEFLRGGEIDWTGLGEGADVARDVYPTLKRALDGVLAAKRTIRLNVFHEPGAGGTTLARRALFDQRDVVPCVAVRSITPGETVRRVDWLARATQLPVLCIIDRPEISDRDVFDFTGELQAISTPATLVHVARRFTEPPESSSAVYLSATLSDGEAAEFYERYAEEVPRAQPELAQVRRFDDQRRSAFYFGLTAFEDDFRGLREHVAGRVDNLNGDQAATALFTALAYFYGQHGLSEHSLARLVGLPPSRANRFPSTLPPGLRSLLWRSTDGYWRPTHQLVALHVLEHMRGRDWRRILTSLALDFAEFCRGDDTEDNELREVIKGVFFDRSSEELLGSEAGGRPLFAQLVEDVPSPEGAVELLASVAEMYPGDAHFAAHVARYYAYRLRNFERARFYADLASSAAPGSHTLQHVLGMVYRAEAYDAIGRRTEMAEVSAIGREASAAFARSRDLAPFGNEHAYISDAQLRIRVIDYAVRGTGSISEYLKTKQVDPYVVECISTAEDLLTSVRGQRDPRNESGFEARARTELTALYGNFDQALQMYDALLAKNPSERVPVRRQIVWTHLARYDRDWKAIPGRALRRISLLLEENFAEAQYSSADIRLWWRAIRFLQPPPSQDRILEVMSYWRASDRSVDALYCSYVAYATEVLDGIRTALPDAEKYLRECSGRARGLAQRSLSLDWVGQGVGIARLVHQSELGGWDRDAGFWRDSKLLQRMEGRVTEIAGPQAGYVDIAGMQAFFVPSRSRLERGRDENARVSGFLGFSLDGPRLWEVSTELSPGR